MAFAITFVLFTSVARMGLASRKKASNNNLDDIKEPSTASCPDEVAENQRGDCLDTDSEIIPSHCCDDLRWCNKQVPEFFDLYAGKIEAYFVKCGLLQNDVGLGEDGKFAIVDNTRICSPQCQNAPGLNEALPDYAQLEVKCVHELLPKLKDQDYFIRVMSDAYSACTTTSTTLPTTFSATTTPYYFDFTDFFGGAQAERSASARFPNGVNYHCCCNPDTDRNAVSCVLKKGVSESIPEFLRKLIWRGCGGALGKDYHSWNNVFTKTHTGEKRVEFEGLEHRGKCIVPNDKLPEELQVWSHYLRNS